jgi:hypothetical protein
MRTLVLLLSSSVLYAAGIEYSIDQVTRYVHVTYSVPASAPDQVEVLAEYRTDGTGDWRPAGVWPHVSDTAIELMRPEDWNAGIREGRLTERRAAGLRRTLIWNPAKLGARKLWVEFRITVSDQGRKL